MLAFHGWMRLALLIKSRFGRQERVHVVREWLAAAYRPSAGEPLFEAIDDAAIDALLRPEGGRTSRWVLERIAEDRGLGLEQVRRDVFPHRDA
jgi:hypothetical protein